MKRFSIENQVVEKVAKEQQAEARERAAQVVRAEARALLSDKDLKKFADQFGDKGGGTRGYWYSDVQNDVNRVNAKRLEIIKAEQDKTEPQAVEYVMRGWLDGGRILASESPSTDPLAVRTHEYDDFFMGVDLVKTVDLNAEQREECGADDLTLAFDVTVAKSEAVIKNKLRQFKNGLPYGFTKIKYYAERRPGREEVTISDQKHLVPRFVIGEDAGWVDVMLRQNLTSPEAREEFLKTDLPDALVTRFKIMSEIYEQAKLFFEKSPERELDGGTESEVERGEVDSGVKIGVEVEVEEEYGVESENKARKVDWGQIERARRQLETVIDMVGVSLSECAEKMVPQVVSRNKVFGNQYAVEVEVFNEDDIAEMRQKGVELKGYRAVEEVQKRLMNSRHSRYDACYTTIMKEVERIRREGSEVIWPEEWKK